MRQESIDAFRAVRAEIEAVHGPLRIASTEPMLLPGGGQQTERMSLVVFIGGKNHGCGIDQPTFGGLATVRAWGFGAVGQVDIGTLEPTVELLRTAAVMVGLLDGDHWTVPKVPLDPLGGHGALVEAFHSDGSSEWFIKPEALLPRYEQTPATTRDLAAQYLAAADEAERRTRQAVDG